MRVLLVLFFLVFLGAQARASEWTLSSLAAEYRDLNTSAWYVDHVPDFDDSEYRWPRERAILSFHEIRKHMCPYCMAGLFHSKPGKKLGEVISNETGHYFETDPLFWLNPETPQLAP